LSPPLKRRRRRGLGWIVALIVVAVTLVIADRVGASLADRAASRYLAQQADFAQPPSVHINGVPFLTQAARGHYDDVEVTGGVVQLDGVKATDLHAQLQGVHLPLSAALGGSIRSLLVDHVQGTLLMTYTDLAGLSPIPGLTISDPDGRLRVGATLKIPGLNATTAVSGIGTVAVVDGALRLSVSEISVAGLSITSAILSQLQAVFAAPIVLPKLPYGLRLDTVTPQTEAVLLGGSGSSVTITRAG
jgi:hypothetical protein